MEIKTKSGKTFIFEFAHYGEARPLNMTDGEAVIAEYIKTLCPVEIVRKSDGYITAEALNSDIVRFKYTDRAKWLLFPYNENKPVKHRLDSLEELNQFDDDIIKSYNIAEEIHALNR